MEANALARDLDRVAVDDAGLAGDLGGARGGQQDQDGEDGASHGRIVPSIDEAWPWNRSAFRKNIFSEELYRRSPPPIARQGRGGPSMFDEPRIARRRYDGDTFAMMAPIRVAHDRHVIRITDQGRENPIGKPFIIDISIDPFHALADGRQFSESVCGLRLAWVKRLDRAEWIRAVSGVSSVLHEIYVKKSAGWELYANYPSHQSKFCLDEAKELFGSGQFEAVRVVKETYNEADNTAHEEVVYRSPCRPQPKRPTPGMARPSQSRPRNVPARARAKTTARPKARPKPKSAIESGAARTAVAALLSLASAAFVTYIVVTVYRQFGGVDIALDNADSRNMILSVFLISSVLFFIAMMRSFGPSLREARGAGQSHEAAGVAKESAAPADRALGEADAQIGSGEALDEHAQAPTVSGEAGPEEDQSKEEAETENVTPLREAAASVSADLLKFIGESLERLVAAGRQLSAFNRFGLTLYFAGAGEYLASRRRLAAHEILEILCAHVHKLGHTLEMARRFCGNIDEYLVSPKYFKMYEAGRAAVALRRQDPDGELGVVEAMDSWNEPATPTGKHDNDFVVVLLTGIGGSAAMEQERGDEAARRAVHEHETIVRVELARHGGREIKRTGHGIMATFPRVVSAVEGAIAMQQACERANAANASLGLGLGLSIGVNAGEPIHERGDNIRTPAQMAARVLTKAEGDEIAVSNIVREMCVGRHYAFTKKGDYELGGSSEPVPIYLLDWRADIDARDDEASLGAEAARPS